MNSENNKVPEAKETLTRKMRARAEDRMIYTIYENKKEIDISSFKGHYQ